MQVSVLRRLSTFSHDISSEAKKPILFIFPESIYRFGERIIVFLFRSDKNSDCYGNL